MGWCYMLMLYVDIVTNALRGYLFDHLLIWGLVLYKINDKYHKWYSQMGFVIFFIIESCLTYVNEFKNKHWFQCYFGLSFFHRHFFGGFHHFHHFGLHIRSLGQPIHHFHGFLFGHIQWKNVSTPMSKLWHFMWMPQAWMS